VCAVHLPLLFFIYLNSAFFFTQLLEAYVNIETHLQSEKIDQSKPERGVKFRSTE
jgi:hypothetical protein